VFTSARESPPLRIPPSIAIDKRVSLCSHSEDIVKVISERNWSPRLFFEGGARVSRHFLKGAGFDTRAFFAERLRVSTWLFSGNTTMCFVTTLRSPMDCFPQLSLPPARVCIPAYRSLTDYFLKLVISPPRLIVQF